MKSGSPVSRRPVVLSVAAALDGAARKGWLTLGEIVLAIPGLTCRQIFVARRGMIVGTEFAARRNVVDRSRLAGEAVLAQAVRYLEKGFDRIRGQRGREDRTRREQGGRDTDGLHDRSPGLRRRR